MIILNRSFHRFLGKNFSTIRMDTTIQLKTAQANNIIREGKAEICMTSENVFYNPVQEFNRDLSIAVINVFGREYKKLAYENDLKRKRNLCEYEEAAESNTDSKYGLNILEALSATGLRSIRYAKEVQGIKKIVANDLSEKAVESIKANVAHNNVEGIVQTSHDDACMLMYKSRKFKDQFSVVDLDPYGCPSIFLDGAVQSVCDGGLLLVTATDMAVLAGNSPETCYTKYGAISLKTKCCHEMALRILLQCIESHANRYSRYITPLLSISADFYIRVFVRINSGAVHCKKTTSKLSMVYHCVGCDQITLQPLGGFKPNPTEKNPKQMKAYLPTGPPISKTCNICKHHHHMGGPIWSAPIHDEAFVNRLLIFIEDNNEAFGTAKRMEGVLSVIREELHDVPLYYTADRMFAAAKLETMPMLLFRSAILNAGYKVSYSHAAKNSVKTNAPPHVLWDIIREWHKTHPVKKETMECNPVARNILSTEMTTSVDLSERSDANPSSRRAGRLRYQANPTPHWGPGTRATARIGEEKISKSLENQNKTFGRLKTKEVKCLKRKRAQDVENTCQQNENTVDNNLDDVQKKI